MPSIQPAIKWAGSKRSQSAAILGHIPQFRKYFEPFAGGASIACALMPASGVCGDICGPLINLWKAIQAGPDEMADQYCIRWERLLKEGSHVFYEIRSRFNELHEPADFLFLSRTCVNGLIRFNRDGGFNNSLHITRRGIEPSRLRRILADWSHRLRGIDFRVGDYWETTADIGKGDFIYLDPPYMNTSGRYYGAIDLERFLQYLRWLGRREVKYALSFDGRRGARDYSADIPKDLYRRQIMLPSGNSSFKKVMGRKAEPVLESLYLNY